MKRFLLFLLIGTLGAAALAGPVRNMPVVCVQPDGDTLRLWATGDEFYHRLHDAEGYTIVLDEKTGWFVYAALEAGQLVPTPYVAGQADPAAAGLEPGLMPPAEELQRLHSLWEVPEEYRPAGPKTSGANHGTLNNVVVFVRFHDEAACTTAPFATINAMFNDSTAGVSSMFNYFKTTSYNKLRIPTVYRPAPAGSTVLSYQDTNNRSYYMPYSATNPGGYVGDADRRGREFGLLERAVNWMNANCPIDTATNLDMDGDGLVDNICFVVSGTYTGWSNLLWPHKWSLYDRYVYINGKRVYTYNLQLAGSGASYFNVGTFCHEMSHTLGCPDLYHYYHHTGVSAAGSWDLMCSDQNPPQQTSSLLKYKYLNWFDSIPQLRDSGQYTLQSLATGANHAYKIAAGQPHQWYILEYRNTADTFDSSLPNRGLLIWRYADLPMASNANFNNADTVHELWLFRPGSNADTVAGTVAQAAFGVAGRSTFSAVAVDGAAVSNPYPYLCNGQADTTFSLTDIEVSGDYGSVSFTFIPRGTACGAVATFPHVMDFEEGHAGCWDFVAASPANEGTAGVLRATTSTTPHDGNFQFRFSSYYSAGDYNQFLISPRLQPAGPLHLVFYYSKYTYGSELFKVKYSTTGNDTADFTATLAQISVTTGGWQRCDLLVPQTVRYVAIDYCSNYQYYLYLDDITLSDTLQEEVQRDTTYLYIHDTLYYTPQDTVEVTVYDTAYVGPDYLQVQIYANFPERGAVSGSGLFPRGTRLEIAAMAARGYAFDSWSDGSRDNPRALTVDGETRLGALFVPQEAALPGRGKTVYVHDTIYVHDTVWLPNPVHDTLINYVHVSFELDTTTYCTLTVLTSDTAMGVAAGSGRFPLGCRVELGAVARPGYRLLHWEDMSQDHCRAVVVTGDRTYTAFFAPEETEGVAERVAAGVAVYAAGGTIVAEAPRGEAVTVYNMLGQQVFRTTAAHEATRIGPLRQGLYLVKVGPRTAQKVLVAGD